MLERLKKLQDNDGALSQYIGKQKDRQEALKKYSREEVNTLEGAVEQVECLKSKVKKEMALIKVIDLTTNDVRQVIEEKQQHGSEVETGKNVEKINYMLVKAKDSMNDAFNILFTKDSLLH